MTRDARRKCEDARLPLRRVFRHEKGAAPGDTLEGPQKAASATMLGARMHIDRTAHPREFSGNCDDALTRA